MFKQLKENMSKAKVGIIAIIIFFVVTSIVTIILLIVILVKLSNPSVANNYNVENVGIVDVQSTSEEPIIKE